MSSPPIRKPLRLKNSSTPKVPDSESQAGAFVWWKAAIVSPQWETRTRRMADARARSSPG